jgi:type II secretory pathway component PulF
MGVFTYKGYDKEGKEQKGVIEASSRSAAISLLKSKGIFPYEVKEVVTRKKRASFSFFRRSFSNQELAIFFRTLATLLDAGISLIEAIESLSEELKEDKKKLFLSSVVNSLREGKSLSESLKEAGINDPIIVSFVSSGEKGGTLVQNLEVIASILEKREEMKSILINALIYPVVLLTVAIGVVIFMMVTVIPKIVSIYTSMKLALPLSTKITLAISNGFVHYYPIILLFILLIISIFLFLEKKNKKRLDKLKLKIPVFGRLILYIELQRFLETLSSLLRAGVPIVEAMTSAIYTVKNDNLKDKLFRIHEELKKGKSLVNLFSREIKELPVVVLQLIKAGEQSGNLSALLFKASNFLRTEVEVRVKNLTSLLEPATMLLVGLIVGFIVFSLLLPIVGISTIKGM